MFELGEPREKTTTNANWQSLPERQVQQLAGLYKNVVFQREISGLRGNKIARCVEKVGASKNDKDWWLQLAKGGRFHAIRHRLEHAPFR